MFQVQYKLRSIDSICGMLFITAETFFACFYKFIYCGNQQRAIYAVDGAVLLLSTELLTNTAGFDFFTSDLTFPCMLFASDFSQGTLEVYKCCRIYSGMTLFSFTAAHIYQPHSFTLYQSFSFIHHILHLMLLAFNRLWLTMHVFTAVLSF